MVGIVKMESLKVGMKEILDALRLGLLRYGLSFQRRDILTTSADLARNPKTPAPKLSKLGRLASPSAS